MAFVGYLPTMTKTACMLPRQLYRPHVIGRALEHDSRQTSLPSET